MARDGAKGDEVRVLRRGQRDGRDLRPVTDLGRDGERASLEDQRPARLAIEARLLEGLLRLLRLLGDARAVLLDLRLRGRAIGG